MILLNESMSKYCSLKAGGKASKVFTPNNITQLLEQLKVNENNIEFIGLGSNLLINENGFDGTIIRTKMLKNISIKNNIITAESGITLAKLYKFANANSKYGAEFLYSIPGTVGGALAMNAGAFGAETWQYVKSVKTIDKKGNIKKRMPTDFDISYRRVEAKNKNEFFLSADFNFNQKKEKASNAKELMSKRNYYQPTGLPSCGSVFKNPKNNFAAKLIESCDLKGFCIGGACISKKHANFIINANSASAKNIQDLIKHIQKIVQQEHNILLEPELIII